MQEDFKEQVKVWLKHHGRSREWLGEKLDKQLQTINNWLSSAKPIPLTCVSLIERLMQDDAAAEAQRQQQLSPANQLFSVEVDLPRFRRYNKASALQNLTLEEWAKTELDKAADEFFRTGQLPELPAQSPPPGTIERQTEIAGTKLRLIQPQQYQPVTSENLKVAEETAAQKDFNARISQVAAEIDAAAGKAPSKERGKSAG